MASSLDRFKVPILLGLVGGLSLLFDVTAASILRAVQPAPEGSPVEQAYRIEHDVYHHALKPDFSTDEAAWGYLYAVRTNNLGFKDRAVRDVPLQTDTHRLLILGDSFTEGIGVPFEQTFVGRVQAALAPEVDVLGAGVSSYAPTIHRALLEHWLDRGLDVDELIVFLDPSDAEDDQWFYRYDPETGTVGSGRGTYVMTGGYKTWIERNTLLTSAVLGLLRSVVSPAPEANVWAWRSAWAWDGAAWRDHGEAGSALGAEHMSAVAARCREEGIPLSAVIYPWPDAVWHQRATDRYTEHWTAWAASEDVPLLNLYPRFLEDPSREAIDRRRIPGDVHWNAEGHRIVAEALLDWRASSER